MPTLWAVLMLATFDGSADAQARILALGDSYTIGEGVAVEDRWPVQLAHALRVAGVSVAEPEIIARTGWTAAELDSAITNAALHGPYALVTLLIGVNNQYQGMIQDSFRAQFTGLLRRAVALAGNDPRRVIALSIPDWGVTAFNTRRDPARIAREIDAYNRIVQAASAAVGAHFVPVTDLTRADPRAVVADGLHPTSAMYARWLERLLPVATTALARQ